MFFNDGNNLYTTYLSFISILGTQYLKFYQTPQNDVTPRQQFFVPKDPSC